MKASLDGVMALLGLVYGVQLGNLMGVANSIAGPEEMVLVYALELCLEGIGSLLGPPLTSKFSVYLCTYSKSHCIFFIYFSFVQDYYFVYSSVCCNFQEWYGQF